MDQLNTLEHLRMMYSLTCFIVESSPAVDRAHDAGKQFRLNVLRQANMLPIRVEN